MISNSSIHSSRGLLVSLFLVLIFTQLKGQQFKLTQGIAITQFNYQNEQGQNVQGLKSGSGLAFVLAYHKASLVPVKRKLLI